MKLPQFIPVLTAFAARVSGRNLDQLLHSPAELARALAETQAVVGHDGVLCIYEGSLLASSCTGQLTGFAGATNSDGDNVNVIAAKPPAEVLRSQPVATVMDAVPVLRHLLSGRAKVFATFAGPGLLHAQLHDAFESCGSAGVESDYVADVILSAVRGSLEMKADGVALIERTISAVPAELLRVYKKVRKLADFYDAGFLLFVEQGSVEQTDPELPAHCIFEFESVAAGMGPVTGRLGPSVEEHGTPYTTAGDLPAGTSVSVLKSLLHREQGG